MGRLVQNLYEESATPLHALGELYISPEGDKYRYVKNGSVALSTGHLLQEAAEDTNFRSMVCAAASAIGSKEITVTLAGTAVTADMFNQGTLLIESGTGLGQKFKIISHTVQTSTTGEVTFTVDRPVKIALVATTTQVTVRKNPYAAVIQYPVTTQTGGAVGFSLYAMTASYYGWIQSGGNTAVLFDTGTNTSNGATGIAPSAAVAGSVAPILDAVGSIVLGHAREVASTDSTFGLAHIIID